MHRVDPEEHRSRKGPTKTREQKAAAAAAAAAQVQSHTVEGKKTRASEKKRKPPTIEDGKVNKKRKVTCSPMISMPSKDLLDRIKGKEAESRRTLTSPSDEKPCKVLPAFGLPQSPADGKPCKVLPPLGSHAQAKVDGSSTQKKEIPQCIQNRRSLIDDLTNQIGNEAKETKRRKKESREPGEENHQAEDDGLKADAIFDDDPQLPGQKGATKAILDRLEAESRCQTSTAVVEIGHHDKVEDKKAQRPYPGSSSRGRNSERTRLRDALTDQIKLNAKRTQVGAEPLQANSAKLRKTGSAHVQGRVFEQEHMHGPT